MEHELTGPTQAGSVQDPGASGTWYGACSCGASWSSFPSEDDLVEVHASHVEESDDG